MNMCTLAQQDVFFVHEIQIRNKEVIKSEMLLFELCRHFVCCSCIHK